MLTSVSVAQITGVYNIMGLKQVILGLVEFCRVVSTANARVAHLVVSYITLYSFYSTYNAGTDIIAFSSLSSVCLYHKIEIRP